MHAFVSHFNFSYFQKAIEGTRFASLQAANPDQIDADLLHWRRIVCFYTLRLMLAPLGEHLNANCL